MIIQIGTERYTASIDALGAELKSLHDRELGREYMWKGDPSWWSGTAPVLFPVIGGLHKGSFLHKGKRYALGSHGFARKSRFRLTDKSNSHAEFELRSDAETKKVYPFDFVLKVAFHTDHSGISVYQTVENPGSGRSSWNSAQDVLLFSLGAHPAFALPFDGGTIEDYYIDFGRPEQAERYYFVNSCLSEKTGPILSNSRQIFLSKTIFNDGPLIFKDIQSREISIRKSRSERKITVSYDTSFLAIWSKPDGAPFICIEPWEGLPDPVGFSDSFEKKPGIRSLRKGESYTLRYRIIID